MTHQQAIDSLAAERYLLDEMSELERHRFEEHFFECVDCADNVRKTALVRKAVRAVGATALPDDRIGRRTHRVRLAVPWTIAATLTLIVGYQSFAVIPALRVASLPQVLTPAVLSPASRGPRIVQLKRTQQFVALSVDIDSADQASLLIYRMRRGPDTDVLAGEAPTPVPGQPLFLLIPTSHFREPGPYVLTVRNASQPPDSAVEYRFAVQEF
jgi:Putative zinc-finger